MKKELSELNFTTHFEDLGDAFFRYVMPTPLTKPYLIHLNETACNLLDLNVSCDLERDCVTYFSGFKIIPNTRPLAMIYSGHQFGSYNPKLGDGRAILLGEVENMHREKWELHLKGAGPTPFSRFGDGRAVLRSVIREYLASEALFHLNIPTTRALCIIGSEEKVQREKIEQGASLIRLSPSHIRFGHFEYFFYNQKWPELNQLLSFVLKQHFPELINAEKPALALLETICKQTAQLVAKWQAVGFQHGVMNTDNMSILSLTLDYGPYAFMDDFNYFSICNHSDETGRYAFDQQPNIAGWNLSALGHTFSHWLQQEEINEALNAFSSYFETHYFTLMREKLGLTLNKQDDKKEQEIIRRLLTLLHKHKVDYSYFLRQLCDFSLPLENTFLIDALQKSPEFEQWFIDYNQLAAAESLENKTRQQQMKLKNPKYILRNYLAEAAIKQAEKGDFSEVGILLKLLKQPFDEQPKHEKYASIAPEWAKDIEISCSS